MRSCRAKDRKGTAPGGRAWVALPETAQPRHRKARLAKLEPAAAQVESSTSRARSRNTPSSASPRDGCGSRGIPVDAAAPTSSRESRRAKDFGPPKDGLRRGRARLHSCNGLLERLQQGGDLRARIHQQVRARSGCHGADSGRADGSLPVPRLKHGHESGMKFLDGRESGGRRQIDDRTRRARDQTSSRIPLRSAVARCRGDRRSSADREASAREILDDGQRLRVSPAHNAATTKFSATTGSSGRRAMLARAASNASLVRPLSCSTVASELSSIGSGPKVFMSSRRIASDSGVAPERRAASANASRRRGGADDAGRQRESRRAVPRHRGAGAIAGEAVSFDVILHRLAKARATAVPRLRSGRAE